MAGGVGLYAWQIEPHWLEIVRRPLVVDRLPTALEGKTLVQLSDIHVGPRVSDKYVADTFARVTALAPDLVVYAGDFNSYSELLFEHAERVYADLPLGRLGTFGTLGNHDYGPHWAHPELAARMADLLRATGIRMLRNEVDEAMGLQFAGMDDLWGKQYDVDKTLAALDPARAAIVLSHNPDTVDSRGWDKYHGWILSGHTHGGQCKPPFLPAPLLPVQNRRYRAGEVQLSGDRKLYISRGVGHTLQVRFNVRPEVTVFELHAG